MVFREHADRIGDQVIEGVPDLVVEILSPGTAGCDLGVKRNAYETAGVPEYWIVDPEAATIEVLTIEASRYVRHGLFGRADTLRSPLLQDLEIVLDGILAV